MIVGEAGKLVSKLTYVCSHSQLMIVGEAGKLVSRAYICLFPQSAYDSWRGWQAG